jgi:hypothetical protein
MKTWAPQELQKVLYTLLSEDADLCALLGTTIGGDQKIFDFVPDNQPYPYVTFFNLPWSNRDNHTWDGWATEFELDVWYRGDARGNKPVQLIQKRIDELLHDASPCIDGWNVVVLKRSFVNIQTDPTDNVTKQGIQRFKLFIGEA